MASNKTPSLDEDTLGSRWQNVREFSFLLSAIGAVITTVLPVLSIGGSGLLLIVITKYPQLRNVPSNLLLASLGVADLLIGLLVQPLHGAACVCVLFGKRCSFISFSNVHFYVGSFLTYSSCLNIAFITIDRYICIVESLRYPAIMTKTQSNPGHYFQLDCKCRIARNAPYSILSVDSNQSISEHLDLCSFVCHYFLLYQNIQHISAPQGKYLLPDASRDQRTHKTRL